MRSRAEPDGHVPAAWPVSQRHGPCLQPLPSGEGLSRSRVRRVDAVSVWALLTMCEPPGARRAAQNRPDGQARPTRAPREDRTASGCARSRSRTASANELSGRWCCRRHESRTRADTARVRQSTSPTAFWPVAAQPRGPGSTGPPPGEARAKPRVRRRTDCPARRAGHRRAGPTAGTHRRS